jgi:hypothetical protein
VRDGLGDAMRDLKIARRRAADVEAAAVAGIAAIGTIEIAVGRGREASERSRAAAAKRLNSRSKWRANLTS